MPRKNWLPVCSLLLLTFLLPGCGGGTVNPKSSNPSANPAPTVTSITPNSGNIAGGTAVTVTGTGFLAGATVSLGGTAATSVTLVSSTSITAVAPAHAAGAVNVKVTNSDAQSATLTSGYTYNTVPPSNPSPTVTSTTPNSGTMNGGTVVSIKGTGFLAGATVKLGGTSATAVTVVNSTTISATTPAHAAGAASVVVTNTDAKTGTLNNGYTFTAPPPAPTVTSITPNSGTINGGTAITISGTGFLTGATVKIGGASATVLAVVNSAIITATTPAHAAGAVDVVVTNTDTKTGTLTTGYTYTASGNPAPTVSSITPASGTTAGGTAVTVNGSNFLTGVTLTIGGTAATSVTRVSSTQITASTPAHAAGAVNVVVTNTDTKTGTLTNGYTYLTPGSPAPTVTSINPATGVTTGGTAVSITGTGFLAGATVSFGGTAGTGVTVVNSTTITASTPALAAGAVNVVVTNTDTKTGTLTNGYTYTAPTGTIALSTVVSGLSNPVGMEHPPGDSRFFIVEQRGSVRILQNGALLPGNFLDLQTIVNYDGQEQGLLGIAFHPNYATNHKFYVNYTQDEGNRETHISEFQTMASDPNTADPNSERVLLVVNQPFPNHKGGQLVFGPDGFLYIGLGDGGSGGDPLGNGQNTSTFLGKMLRINVDPPFATGKEYGIPADNPFATSGGLPEIFAYGLRNPWRFSFEPVTNRLFVADVGQDSWEEIDVLQNGGNFGWNVMEGKHCYPPGTATCDMTNKILPIFEYSHTDGIAVIGGYIYKGTAIPSLANKYVFADLTGKVWSLTEAPANTWTRGNLLDTGLTFTSFGKDAAGELYLVDYNGLIRKLVLQ